MLLNILAIALALSATTSAMKVGSAADDHVEKLDALPGWPSTTNFSIYSGFIPVPDTSKQIHYVFLESMTGNHETDPLVVWFNGGPGCSSMLGLLQETGPFVLEDNATTYTENLWAWNKETNILYIEQPAGVGYSTCDNSSRPQDCNHTDLSSSEDNLKVLLGWFDRFEGKYKHNKIYIAGESYAGVYVPFLSWQISEWNKNQTADDDKINLAGFMVGNGVTNWTYDTTPATVDVAFYRSLVSTSTYRAMENLNCNFSGVALQDFSNCSRECRGHLSTLYQAMQDIDVYNIYGRCWGADLGGLSAEEVRNQLYGKAMINGEEKEYKKFMTAQEYTPWIKRVKKSKTDDDTDYGIPPCIYARPAAEHLNTQAVRDQLNIKNSQVWRMCSVAGESTFSYTISARASQWAYEALKGTIRMLHYSGDQDASVPTIGTERWVNGLQWATTKPWGPYTLADKQVAGYYQQFEGDFSLVTVHGAGHMVPQDQRERAYHILFNWVFQREEFATSEEPKAAKAEPELLQW